MIFNNAMQSLIQGQCEEKNELVYSIFERVIKEVGKKSSGGKILVFIFTIRSISIRDIGDTHRRVQI